MVSAWCAEINLEANAQRPSLAPLYDTASSRGVVPISALVVGLDLASETDRQQVTAMLGQKVWAGGGASWQSGKSRQTRRVKELCPAHAQMNWSIHTFFGLGDKDVKSSLCPCRMYSLKSCLGKKQKIPKPECKKRAPPPKKKKRRWRSEPGSLVFQDLW